MWLVYELAGVTVLLDAQPTLLALGVGARGERLCALAARHNRLYVGARLRRHASGLGTGVSTP